MKKIVHPNEQRYFWLSVMVSAVFYGMLIAGAIAHPELGVTMLIYGGIFALFSFFGAGIFTGWVKGNALRLSQYQFPQVYALAERISSEIGLKELPPVYILEGNGVLNAFAAKFLGRYYVLIYSEVFELAFSKGEAELAFVLAHELAHIKRRHLSSRWLTLPAHFVPFLANAYSRGCELSSDRIAAHVVPYGAAKGLLCLTAGKSLYRHASIETYLEQTGRERGFWVWFSEILSTHPHLPQRIAHVRSYLSDLATPEPVARGSKLSLGTASGWALR